MTTPTQAEINAAIELVTHWSKTGQFPSESGLLFDKIKIVLATAKEVEHLRKDYEQMVSTFHHMHINNQKDDACEKCGLDLRHEVHLVYEGK